MTEKYLSRKVDMKACLKLTIFVFLIGQYSCEKEGEIKFYTDSIESNKYYSNEIIPAEYNRIYGKWKLYRVSGGFSGRGYEPDFDYLEIKSVGIYGLVRNNSVFEYGKIELDTFDNNNLELFQVKLVPDYFPGLNPYMSAQEKYIDLKRIDSMDLISPCCDMYNFHFRKVK
jgi:hypothetical protein